MSDISTRKVNEPLYEIDQTGAMRVPARIYADAELMGHSLKDKSLEQAANVATLPGIVKYSLAMPDIHWGYGFPIGGVAAMKSIPEKPSEEFRIAVAGPLFNIIFALVFFLPAYFR